MTIEIMVAVLSPLLSLVGGAVGAAVAIGRHDVRIAQAEKKLDELSRRSHKHSTLLTLIAGKVGIRGVPEVYEE